ncbi:MAG: protein kinase [Planctomycetes bacterium]|nr:protein kinase [Planctomycetota bacterium]
MAFDNTACDESAGDGLPAVRSEERFRVLRPHARGGLGEVYLARDQELNREVALKEIQERYADHPAARSRFLREAEITGGLEHPGIVPVYGLGSYEDGRPYYAMRFIRGDSLKDAIDRFHQPVEGRRAGLFETPERSLEFRGLLRRLIDVCNAVEYAHSRGVVHRDLKPANIMLGKYGETLVVDWGLAKAKGQTEPDVTSEQPGDSTSSESVLTQMGAVIGTLEYMSPEQAAGRLDLVGPASDVYSLGATLYCLLTGATPFNRSDDGTLERIQRGQFLTPREIQQDVPRALEAVCLRAMSKRPEDRYLSAIELAKELERWLADEPVTTFREPVAAKIRRWARRHTLAVTSAGILFVTAMTAFVLGLWFVKQEQLRTAYQANLALRARQVSAQVIDAKSAKEQALRDTRQAYVDFQATAGALLSLIVDVQDQIARTSEVRDAVLQTAFTGLQTVRTRMNEAEAKAPRDCLPAVASARLRLAHAFWDAARPGNSAKEAAIQEYEHVRGLYERIAEDSPEWSWRRLGLEIDAKIADACQKTGDKQLANHYLDSFDRALKEHERLNQARTGDAAYQQHLALCHLSLGDAHVALGNLALALDAFNASADASRVRLTRYPSPQVAAELSATYVKLGDTAQKLGTGAAARDYYGQAADLLEDALASRKIFLYGVDRPEFYAKLADVQLKRGDFSAAFKAAMSAADDWKSRATRMEKIAGAAAPWDYRRAAQAIQNAATIAKLLVNPQVKSSVLSALPEDGRRVAEMLLPGYLTPERRRATLLLHGSFEGMTAPNWSSRSWRGRSDLVASVSDVHKLGDSAIMLRATDDDAGASQKVTTKPNMLYLFSGWVKTQDVTITEKGGTMGASLSIWGGFEASESVVGTFDWTYVTLVFYTGDRNSVELGPRLGHHSSTATGTAWFDDLVLLELPN